MTYAQQRACKTCSLCCKVLAVDDAASPDGQWCEHVCDGGGCNVYGTVVRPEACDRFVCLWAMGDALEYGLRPDKSGVVMSTTADGEDLVAHVDPDRPDAWKQGLMGKRLAQIVDSGERVFVVIGKRRLLLSKVDDEVVGGEPT